MNVLDTVWQENSLILTTLDSFFTMHYMMSYRREFYKEHRGTSISRNLVEKWVVTVGL